MIIIKLGQTCFIKGRFIIANIIAVCEGMEWPSHYVHNILVIKTTFEKTYVIAWYPFILPLAFEPISLKAFKILFTKT